MYKLVGGFACLRNVEKLDVFIYNPTLFFLHLKKESKW